MAEITIIGAGRLGTALGRALAKKGHVIKALTCRGRASAKESRRVIGRGRIYRHNAAAAARGQVIFLCLADDQVRKVAAELARANIDWTRKIVFHTSGLLSSGALALLKEKGAATASFHPVQSFARKDTPPAYFKGIYFGLEGERRALTLARKIVQQLGGHPLTLRPNQKPYYHAACSMTSNFLVILLNAATHLLIQAGIEEKKALKLLLPLAEGTLHNVKKFDISSSLTGPILRGDAASIKAHLEALRRFPDYAEAYKKLGLLALQMARKKGLTPKKIKTLRNLLEGN
jgi:predicted short-subunit dehydrogenase-like oxidoreductase (DUF2520 family)